MVSTSSCGTCLRSFRSGGSPSGIGIPRSINIFGALTIAVSTVSGPPGLNRSQVLALISKGTFDHDDWYCSALDEDVLDNDMEDGWHAAVKEGSFDVFDEDDVELP